MIWCLQAGRGGKNLMSLIKKIENWNYKIFFWSEKDASIINQHKEIQKYN